MANTEKALNGGGKNLSVDELAAQIDALKSELATLTDSLSEFGTSKADEAATVAKDKAMMAQLQAEEFVRKQPATSLGLAAGLGFLVGMMTARR